MVRQADGAGFCSIGGHAKTAVNDCKGRARAAGRPPLRGGQAGFARFGAAGGSAGPAARLSHPASSGKGLRYRPKRAPSAHSR